MKSNEMLTLFTHEKVELKNVFTTGELWDFSECLLGYILQGSVKILYQGKTIEAHPGDLLYISKGTRYYSIWTGTPNSIFYSIHFSFVNKYAYSQYKFQVVKGYSRDKFDDIQKNYTKNPLEALSSLYSILSDLYGGLLTKSADTEEDSIISPAVKYIEENYKSNITIHQLASLCCVSESYFYSVFRKLIGCSPIKYKHICIAKHAIDELLYTHHSIEEISESLGFSSPNYFRRIFHDITGKNPTDIRKQSKP